MLLNKTLRYGETMSDSNNNPHVLLVEGADDEHVVYHLRARSGENLEFEVIPKDGIDGLLSSVEVEINVPDRKVMGILIDADDDVAARWCAVTNRLKQAKSSLQIPPQPDPDGTVLHENPQDRIPRIGIWMMPNNESPGELEDFIARMIPGGDAVWPLSEKYIACIPKPERKFKSGKKLRAQVHAWLAARERPRPLGLAIKTRDLEVEPNSQTFINWLQRLFSNRSQIPQAGTSPPLPSTKPHDWQFRPEPPGWRP